MSCFLPNFSSRFTVIKLVKKRSKRSNPKNWFNTLHVRPILYRLFIITNCYIVHLHCRTQSVLTIVLRDVSRFFYNPLYHVNGYTKQQIHPLPFRTILQENVELQKKNDHNNNITKKVFLYMETSRTIRYCNFIAGYVWKRDYAVIRCT